MGPGMMGGFLFMLLLLIAAVILVVWIVKMMSPQQGGSERTSAEAPVKEDAVELARKRYARGEISKEEFEQIKIDLQ